MPQLFADNVRTTLSNQLLSESTEMQVADFSKFPTLNSGDWFKAVLIYGLDIEIVKVTGGEAAGSRFFIERGLDGTTPRTFVAGETQVIIAPVASDHKFFLSLQNRANHVGTQDVSTITGLETVLIGKVDKEPGKDLSTNDYTTADKDKLAGVAAGATANASDAELRNRSTHTGLQPISSVNGLQSTLDAKASRAGGAFTGGINFGSITAGSTGDLSRHIALYGTAYGFNVTGDGLNYNAGQYAWHAFWSGTTVTMAAYSNGAIRGHKGFASAGGGANGNLTSGRGFFCNTDTAVYGGPYDDHSCFGIWPYMGAGWTSGEIRFSIAGGSGYYSPAAMTLSEAGLDVKGEVTSRSDRKLKDNIETIPDALNKVCAMRGVYYTLKADETKTRHVGVVAQEVQEVMPELVKGVKVDPKLEEETLVVAYAHTVGLLIEAIKELRAEVAELKGQK